MPNVRKPTPISEARKHGPEYMKRWNRLKNCEMCGRKVRPSNGKASDWPVTVSYGSTELCISCKQNPNPEERIAKPVDQVSVSAALRQSDGVAPRLRESGRGRLSRIPDPKTRQQIAEEWSEDERSVAMWVCGMSEDALEAEDILGSLGLLEDKALRPMFAGPLQNVGRTPKGYDDFGT